MQALFLLCFYLHKSRLCNSLEQLIYIVYAQCPYWNCYKPFSVILQVMSVMQGSSLSSFNISVDENPKKQKQNLAFWCTVVKNVTFWYTVQ